MKTKTAKSPIKSSGLLKLEVPGKLVRIAGLESAFSFCSRLHARSFTFVSASKYKGFVHVQLLGVKLGQMNENALLRTLRVRNCQNMGSHLLML